ncbi:MAG TPA: hypothetical protein VK469_13875 [Candidatus Kapabacteria bacterium]|nr:hypothetical protein [Bacteroidales bacterium]HLP47035.1 hypothetical protein [Candidatus Kapabacteria bacterium]
MTRIEQILSGLQSIVNDYSRFAIIWHALFYFLVAALLLKWTPSNRVFGMLLCLPLLSVSLFAWAGGNPFNGSLFAIAAVLVFIFGLKAPDQPVETSGLIFFLAGIIMVSFGLIYPHFIKPASFIGYLYASPAGLIPCPTLSVLIGLALIFNGFGSQSISLLLIIFGLFYGAFGVFKLKVQLDLFLLFGAVIYLIKYLLSIRVSAT